MYRRLILALTLLCAGLHLQAQQDDDRKMARFDSIASALFVEGNYEEALNTLLLDTHCQDSKLGRNLPYPSLKEAV